VLRQGNAFSSGTPGNIFRLPYNKGFFVNQGTGVNLSVPILRLNNGAAETLVRLNYGRVRVQVRPFLNPRSLFIVSDRTGTPRIRAQQTDMEIDATTSATIIRIHGGEATVIGDAQEVLIVEGSGAVILPGYSPWTFTLNRHWMPSDVPGRMQ
jgi:hypothetical protein